MWVVKIGGSLSGNPGLSGWLDVLTEQHSQRGVVIVPGGGRFADTVRDAQRRWEFDDGLAHGMSLRAMEQYGMMMTGINDKLVIADSTEKIIQALDRKMIPVWMPYNMVNVHVDIVQDWSMTSDSLAAWLARELNANALILIKSVRLNSRQADMHELCASSVVDEHFPEMLKQLDFPAYIFNAEDYEAFRDCAEIPVESGLHITGHNL